MTTEDDKHLRQILRMAHQLPQPTSDLLGRVSKEFSKRPKLINPSAYTQSQREKYYRRVEGLKRYRKDYSLASNEPQFKSDYLK